MFVFWSYVLLIASSWLCFALQYRQKLWKRLLPIAVGVFFLLISNPGLSYDLFNYLFDARLVLKYHLDPHVASAITYQGIDPWVSYMRNTFFPTTYWYAWTAIPLVPYMFGLGKFILTFWAFKAWTLVAFVGLFLIDRSLIKKPERLMLFFLNPLVLLELLMNGHNDVWMMVTAHLGVLFLWKMLEVKGKARQLLSLGLSLLFLGISSEVKRATALLLPLWVALPFTTRSLKPLKAYWADLAALLMFAPLLTPLSRQFNPWYLVWSLSFLPFAKTKLVRVSLICFSVTSTLRYLPILWNTVYSEQQLFTSKMITWSAVPLILITLLVTTLWEKTHRHV